MRPSEPAAHDRNQHNDDWSLRERPSSCKGEGPYRRSFEEAPVGMAWVAPDGRLLKANHTLCELLGYSEPDLLAAGMPTVTGAGDAAADEARAEELAAGGRRSYQTIKRLRHKLGHTVCVTVNVSLVREGGCPLHFVWHVQDAADRRSVERLQEDRIKALEMVASDRPLAPVLTHVVSMVERQLPGSVASVLLLKDGCLQQWGPSVPQSIRQAVGAKALSLAAALCAHPVGQEQRLRVSDIVADEAWAGVRQAAAGNGLCCCWSLSIRCPDRTFLALFAVYVPKHRRPAGHEVRVLEAAARLLKVALDHFHVTRRLAHLAGHDALTGLANRMVFEDRLQQAVALARRSGGSLAVLAIDLDDFKTVNDSLGHEAGDFVLQQAGRRLCEAVRECDTAARMGGDEFALLLPGAGDRAEAERAAASIVAEVFSTPFQVAGRELHVSGSIGIGVYPGDGDNAPALRNAADADLYRVKHGRPTNTNDGTSGPAPA